MASQYENLGEIKTTPPADEGQQSIELKDIEIPKQEKVLIQIFLIKTTKNREKIKLFLVYFHFVNNHFVFLGCEREERLLPRWRKENW